MFEVSVQSLPQPSVVVGNEGYIQHDHDYCTYHCKLPVHPEDDTLQKPMQNTGKVKKK